MMKKILFACLFGWLFLGCSEDCEAPTTTMLYGSVSDQTTGNPIASVEVKLSVLDGYGTLHSAAVTGSDGCFNFPDLDPKWLYAIEINHPGYKYFSQRVRVKTGERNEVHLLIEPKR